MSTLVALRKVRLDGIMGSGKFKDLISTNASVVVSARSNSSIARATQLGVVPYGDGELNVKLEAGASAQATEHYFGGAHQTKPLTFEKGSLRVPLRERTEDGALVEWIEVSILGG